MNDRDVQFLMQESDSSLRAALGLYALPLVEPPGSMLTKLKANEMVLVDKAVWGSEDLRHPDQKESVYLQSVVAQFFKNWGMELRKAICGNSDLVKKERDSTLAQLPLFAIAVAGAIAQAVPQLAPLTGLLTVLGVIIAKTGLAAFCQSLDPA